MIGANVAQGGRLSSQLISRRASKGVGPVLDDSDFDLEDDSKKSDKQAKDLNSILDAADKFAIKKDKQGKKSSSLMSLEDELKGMALEDEVDLSVGLMKTARTGKVDVSLEGRLAKWAMETKELVTNPTKLQLTYVTIFSASVALLVLTGVVTFATGAVHFKGEGIDYEARANTEEDPFIQRYKLIKANKEKMMSVKDVRDLYNPDPDAPDSVSKGQWGLSDSMPSPKDKARQGKLPWELEKEAAMEGQNMPTQKMPATSP